jgi:DnaJ-class molecular chaperone
VSDNEQTCNACNGSGEGASDGLLCYACSGLGIKMLDWDDLDAYDVMIEEDWEF